jgi:hypothetical protein
MALAGTFTKLDETARMMMARQTLTSEALEMARQVIEVQTEALLRLRAEGDSLRAILTEVRALAVERGDLTMVSVMDSRQAEKPHES